MKELNDDIFDHIKEALRSHEEPYDEGAWERFKAKSMPDAAAAPVKRPVIALWKWTAAAAAVAGILLFARIFNSSENIPNTQPGKSVVTNIPSTDAPSQNGDITTTPEAPEISSTTPANGITVSTPRNTNTPDNAAITSTNAPNTITYTALPPSQAQITAVTEKPAETSSPVAQQPQPDHNVDFWKSKIVADNPVEKNTIPQENKTSFTAALPPAEKIQSEKSRRWQPSLYVSPVFGDQGINMGYGVSVGYAINDKIKISSGIAHTKISTSRAFDEAPPIAAAAPASLATAGKSTLKTYSFIAPQQTSTLQQVDGSLSGIDIPVEINYNFSKKIYAAAGVSGLVVLDDKKRYTYEDSRNVKVSVETNKGILKEDKSVTFNESSTSSAPIQAPAETTPFLGFYNLSIGYKQKITDKNAVSIEPFIKFPMKNVTQQNLNYKGTGIRLKFDF